MRIRSDLNRELPRLIKRVVDLLQELKPRGPLAARTAH